MRLINERRKANFIYAIAMTFIFLAGLIFVLKYYDLQRRYYDLLKKQYEDLPAQGVRF